jgi:hypothetical protein
MAKSFKESQMNTREDQIINMLTPVLNVGEASELARLICRGDPDTDIGKARSRNAWIQALGDSALVWFDGVAGATSYDVIDAGSRVLASGASSPIALSNLRAGQVYGNLFLRANLAGSYSSVTALPQITSVALPAALAAPRSLLCWYDAGQEPAVANGTAVASITDWSGNGYGASQATAGLRPTYATAANWGGGATGRPALKFDGADDFLQSVLTSRRIGSRATVFIVCAFTGLTNGPGARDMRVMSNESLRYDGGWYVGTSDSGPGGGGNSCIKVRSDARQTTTAAGGPVINTPYVISVVHGRQLFLDGVIAATPTPGSGNIGLMTPRSQGLCIGGITADTNQAFAGSVAEIVAFNGLLTDAQRWAVEAYLSTKYGKGAPAQQATIA